MSVPEQRPRDAAGAAPQPRRRAAALRYTGGAAPTVVAAGAGAAADRIEALATEHGVPVCRDPALAEALSRLPVDTDIPPELYRAAAEVLIWARGLEILARSAAGREA